MSSDKPVHLHDCDSCIFLGNMPEDPAFPCGIEVIDLYSCPQGGKPTVVARFGVDEDYTSGLSLAPIDPYLAEAKRRAEERSLL